MASTLLQLVNRVRRRLRAGDTAESGFDQDELNLVLVDLLNASGDAVLGQNEWSFEVRHDGVIRTFARQEFTGAHSVLTVLGTSYLFRSGSPGISVLAEQLDVNGDDVVTARVQRVLLAALEGASDTALTIVATQGAHPIAAVYIQGAQIAEPLGVTESLSGTVTLFANEYILSPNVKRVLSVTHQASPVRLEEVNRTQVFDRFVQRPQESFSDRPEAVVIGGKRLAMFADTDGQFSATPFDPADAISGTSLTIWPTPISQLLLNYSYVVAYPQLSVVTDTWDGIDPMVESAIVELAYAKAMQTDVGKDVEAGVILETRALGNVKQLLAMDRQMPGQHLTLRSHFGPRGQPFSPGRMPRHFGSL